MSKQNFIGIDIQKAKILAEKLNVLLADYQVFYMNVRGLHWNIRGEKFFELHVKFEELYTNLLLKLDEVGERILTLGKNPLHAFTDYLKVSDLKEVKNIHKPHEAIDLVITSLQTILKKERELLSLSEKAKDEGTNSLMSDYIREKEKMLWMYASYQKQ